MVAEKMVAACVSAYGTSAPLLILPILNEADSNVDTDMEIA